MTDFTTVTVLIPTYKRHEIVKDCVDGLYCYLTYRGSVRILISTDADDAAGLREIFAEYDDVRVLQGPGHGLGANLNFLLRSAESDLLLQMDDDHVLGGHLNITEHARKLLEDQTAGCIRLMGVGGHKYHAFLEGHYWRLDWNSPECYIASNRPHLKHRRFHEVYGYYREGLSLGATEESFCHIAKDKGMATDGYPSVLVPLDVLTESLWSHVGTSWQGQGF